MSTADNSNNLNINVAETNAVLRLEVELRDKNARRPRYKPDYHRNAGEAYAPPSRFNDMSAVHGQSLSSYFVPLEKVRHRIVIEKLSNKVQLEQMSDTIKLNIQ